MSAPVLASDYLKHMTTDALSRKGLWLLLWHKCMQMHTHGSRRWGAESAHFLAQLSDPAEAMVTHEESPSSRSHVPAKNATQENHGNSHILTHK